MLPGQAPKSLARLLRVLVEFGFRGLTPSMPGGCGGYLDHG